MAVVGDPFSKNINLEKPSIRPRESLYQLETSGYTAALKIQPRISGKRKIL